MQTVWAAWMRAGFQAFVQFVGTTLLTYQGLDSVIDVPIASGDMWRASLIAGGLAACFALGFRGLAEGTYDGYRASTNQQSTADVGFDKLAGDP